VAVHVAQVQPREAYLNVPLAVGCPGRGHHFGGQSVEIPVELLDHGEAEVLVPPAARLAGLLPTDLIADPVLQHLKARRFVSYR
jgi:hypothetical protein